MALLGKSTLLMSSYFKSQTRVATETYFSHGKGQKLEQAELKCKSSFKVAWTWGAWVAQSVKRPTSAQVTISRSVSLSPESGSGLMARSLEPVSDSVSPSLSAPPPFMLCLSLCLKNK